jgi:preprotein translocase SecE subunit
VSKLAESLGGLRTFWSEVIGETKKCEWPAKDELIQSTIVVIAFLLIVAMYVGVGDRILVVVMERAFRLHW